MKADTNGIPRVVLLGRTNVGKSTFFSRVSGTSALTSSTPHTTRDAKETLVEWHKKTFLLIDTGGFDIERTDPLHLDVQTRIARELKRASHILLMTDNSRFLTDQEKNWVKEWLGRVPITIIVNKADKPHMRRGAAHIYYKGVRVFPVSSINGGGTGDVLDYLVESLIDAPAIHADSAFRLGLIGRTNVGKSSLLNTLAKEERAIVNARDHTTREPMRVVLNRKGKHIEVLDTAGIQKNPKQQIMRESQEVTREAMQECDVIALITEAGKFPIPAQDIELAHNALNNGKSLFIVVNKWDLSEDQTTRGQREETKRLRRAVPQMNFVPIIMASAKTGHGALRILDTAIAVYRERFIELEPARIRKIQKRLAKHVWLVQQLAVDPPRFHAIGTQKFIPRAVNDIFQKAIRSEHPFQGTPLITSIAKRNARHATHHRPGESG